MGSLLFAKIGHLISEKQLLCPHVVRIQSFSKPLDTALGSGVRSTASGLAQRGTTQEEPWVGEVDRLAA